jgi:hypothetical protein
MAMRSMVSAVAEYDDSSAVNSATVQEALRMIMIYPPSDDRKIRENHEQVSGQLQIA